MDYYNLNAGQDRSMWRTLRPSAGQAQQWVSEWVNERELSFAEWQRSRVCVCRARLWSSWSYGRTWTILPAWHRRTHRLTVPHYSWPDFRAGHVVVAVVCPLSVPSSRHISKTKQDRPIVTMDLSKLASLILRHTQILPRRCPREINTTYVSCY